MMNFYEVFLGNKFIINVLASSSEEAVAKAKKITKMKGKEGVWSAKLI